MDEPSTGDAAARPPAPRFFESKVGLLIVGFVLTTVFGGALNAWIQYTTWKREVGFSLYQTQIEKAGALQKQVLNGSGELRVVLNEVRRLTVIAGPGGDELALARSLFDEKFWPMWQSWRANVHQMRNDIALIFGQQSAETFLSRADNVYFYDLCSVVVIDGDPKTSGDCGARRGEERRRLLKQEPVTEPASLHHAFRLAIGLVRRHLRCRERSEIERSGREECGNMRDLKYIANWRYNKTGGARDRLADAIYAEMLRLRKQSR